jgi:hypothetical protein
MLWAVVVFAIVALERKITIEAADPALQTRRSQYPCVGSRFNLNRIHKQKLDCFGLSMVQRAGIILSQC